MEKENQDKYYPQFRIIRYFENDGCLVSDGQVLEGGAENRYSSLENLKAISRKNPGFFVYFRLSAASDRGEPYTYSPLYVCKDGKTVNLTINYSDDSAKNRSMPKNYTGDNWTYSPVANRCFLRVISYYPKDC